MIESMRIWQYIWKDKVILFFTLLFSIISLSFIVGNGLYRCQASICGLWIGDWHLHDALWHISLAKLGFATWPLQNPFMAGETLTGYNFLLDYLLHLLIRLGISPFLSFFQLLPVAATCLYIWSVTSYIATVAGGRAKARWLAFFLYFGSSATYLATLYAGHTFYYASLRGFPVVSVINPTTMFLNIQFAFSLSIFLWIMLLVKRADNWRKYLGLAILFFLLFGFKFYGGVVALVYVCIGQLLTAGAQRKIRPVLAVIPALIGSCLGLALFYGLGSARGLPFTWSPLSLTHLMIDDKLLFATGNLTLARYYLYEHVRGFSPKLWAIETLSIALFVVINFGTRLLGFLYVLRASYTRKLGVGEISMALTIILTVLAPLLFVQNGGWYNTMQFLYYGVWLTGIFAAEFITRYIDHQTFSGRAFLILIVLLTVPNTIEQLRFITAQQHVIGSDELAMLEILKKSEPGVVHISEPVHKLGLVPALAEKSTYYLDTDQLMVTHAHYEEKLALIEKYAGGSITTIPANYFLIYKQDYGSEAAIHALTSLTQYQLLYDSESLALYKKL